MVTSIENRPGKQGSVAMYRYLQQTFGRLDATAVEHDLVVFIEYAIGARNHPGAHPNVDHLLAIAAGEPALRANVVKA